MNTSKAGRKTEPASDLRAERIRKLMEWEKLSQEKLGAKLGMAQQNISRILKSKKISENTISLIIEAFPNYRKQWLLGYDDIPTVEEWEKRKEQTVLALNTARKESDLLFLATSAFASLSGYNIKAKTIADNALKDSFHNLLSNMYSIEKDGKCISLSTEDMNHFENLLCDMAESAFRYLFKERSVDNG